MTLDQEDVVFARLLALKEQLQELQNEEGPVLRARIAVQLLRRHVAELHYGGVISLRKISIEPRIDLGEDFDADWSALKATLFQKGLRWC